MPNLSLVAHIRAKADKAELVKDELLTLIPITRTEQGCITYDLYQDHADLSYFMVFEVWESREVWQAHKTVPHLAAFMAATDGAIADFTVNEMSQIA